MPGKKTPIWLLSVPQMRLPSNGDPVACQPMPLRCVPGATRSGLTRASAVGPRLENVAMSWTLFASPLRTSQASVPNARWLSLAPTVMTFLAVAGVLIVRAPGPPLPAATTSIICCAPGCEGTASRTIASYSWAVAS